jgi:alkaline phosphatase D
MYKEFWSILFFLALFGSSCSKSVKTIVSGDSAYFPYGVASGDPSESSVILWTAIEADLASDSNVEWAVSRTEDMNSVVASGTMVRVTPEAPYYKVKASGLQSNKEYFYQFTFKKERSPIGKTKTIGPTDQLNIGVVSCSNFEAGYFNAYESLAKQDVDVVLHLGDYIYEYGPGTYGDSTLQRKHIPAKEILTLDDYRQRYAQYRRDKSLQRVHQNHPFINIWDDHEISNNAYKTGAQNHQDNEGAYAQRAAAAKQAYAEWMPIDMGLEDPLYRSFSFGDFASLIMLDGRLQGRTEPVKNGASTSNQSMLGREQLQWMKNQLSASKAKWKILGNQVIFSQMDLSRVSQRTHNMDAWDGYAEERNDIINYLATNDIQDVLIVSGDTHMSWGIEVPFHAESYPFTDESVAVEIGTPSISSSNLNEGAPTEDVIVAERILKVSNPHLKYVDGRNHGYVILRLQEDLAIVDWYGVSNLKSPVFTEKRIKRMTINREEQNKLK